MRPRQAFVTCALVVVLGSAGAGCSEDEPDPVSAADLPDDLCGAVPENVVARWQLTDADHHRVGGDDLSEASCEMTGTVDDEPVRLVITLTSFGGADADAVRSLVADDIATRCAALEEQAVGRFVDEENRCSTETGAGADQGQVTEVSRSIPSHGVVTVTMTHGGTMWQLVGPEVVGLSGIVANTEPDALS